MSLLRASRPAQRRMRMTTIPILVRPFAQRINASQLIILIDSEISTDDEDDVPVEETLTDRILALKDIIPPTTRSYIASKVESGTGWVKSGLLFGGKTLWIVSTSALLLGVPWALAFVEEQQVVEMENEMKMREQGTKDVRD
jgi:hypothetical protein